MRGYPCGGGCCIIIPGCTICTGTICTIPGGAPIPPLGIVGMSVLAPRCTIPGCLAVACCPIIAPPCIIGCGTPGGPAPPPPTCMYAICAAGGPVGTRVSPRPASPAPASVRAAPTPPRSSRPRRRRAAASPPSCVDPRPAPTSFTVRAAFLLSTFLLRLRLLLVVAELVVLRHLLVVLAAVVVPLRVQSLRLQRATAAFHHEHPRANAHLASHDDRRVLLLGGVFGGVSGCALGLALAGRRRRLIRFPGSLSA